MCSAKNVTNLALASAFVTRKSGANGSETRGLLLSHTSSTSNTLHPSVQAVIMTVPHKREKTDLSSFYNVQQCDTRGPIKVFLTQRADDRSDGSSVSTTRVASDSERKRRRKRRRKEWSESNRQCEKDYSLFFWPLYCWAFFFCLGTD